MTRRRDTDDEIAIVELLIARPGLTSRQVETELEIRWSTLKRKLKRMREEGLVLPSGERVRLVSKAGHYEVQVPGVIPRALERAGESVERARGAMAASIARAMEAGWGWRTIRGPLVPRPGRGSSPGVSFSSPHGRREREDGDLNGPDSKE